MSPTEKLRYRNMEDYGFGPNVMKKTKVCARCGRMVGANAKTCPECDTVLASDSQYCPHCGKQMLLKAAGNGKDGG